MKIIRAFPKNRKIEFVSFPSMNNEWLTQSAKNRISNLLESRSSESAEKNWSEKHLFRKVF